MRAVEDLLNEVRDSASREHLGEAVRAYHAGALRSSIISTWVAVALDLVGKVRELADMGEPAASRYVSELERAISGDNVRTLTRLERELLDRARDDFELIAAREHVELSRLLNDRHVCAHPAFVNPDVIFTPTPELCRAHIATAVDAVLKHGPTPGRKALDRFMAEVRGTSWPATPSELAGHLRARYIERGKEALRRNLAVVIVKGCIERPDGDAALAVRLSDAAHALESIAPALLDTALADVVTRREQASGLNEIQLVRLVGALGDLEGTWRALPSTSHPLVVAAVTNAALEDLLVVRAFAVEVAHADVAAAVNGRLARLAPEDLARAIEASPGPRLVPYAIAHLREAGGWRAGETRMRQLILPLTGYLDLLTLTQIHDVLRDNNQVREASRVPPMVETLFDETLHISGALARWQEVSDWLRSQGRDEDPDDWYAYPSLAKQVARARREPVSG